MNPDPPIIEQNETIGAAKAVLSRRKEDHLVVVDEEKRLLGYVDHQALEKDDAVVVRKVMLQTKAHLPVLSSLKDGLSEIFSHDLGFIIALDEDRRVAGILQTDDIKTMLRR